MENQVPKNGCHMCGSAHGAKYLFGELDCPPPAKQTCRKCLLEIILSDIVWSGIESSVQCTHLQTILKEHGAKIEYERC